MTNTNVPATQTGIVCGRCSYGLGKDRVQVRHASIAAVQLCYSTPVAPVVAAPVPAPQPKAFGRFLATCKRTGCTTHAVKDHKFTLKCSNHGARPVYTPAKQLIGTLSTKGHKCNDACMFAKGPECVCGCGGVNHGLGYLVKL
jgi:hypothetical protein